MGDRGEEGDTRQSATTEKAVTAETQRGECVWGGTREVCGGPTPNPASAPGSGNRGAISVKTHTLPAYRLNEATSAFRKETCSPPPLTHTHTRRKTWKLSIALFKI